MPSQSLRAQQSHAARVHQLHRVLCTLSALTRSPLAQPSGPVLECRRPTRTAELFMLLNRATRTSAHLLYTRRMPRLSSGAFFWITMRMRFSCCVLSEPPPVEPPAVRCLFASLLVAARGVLLGAMLLELAVAGLDGAGEPPVSDAGAAFGSESADVEAPARPALAVDEAASGVRGSRLSSWPTTSEPFACGVRSVGGGGNSSSAPLVIAAAVPLPAPVAGAADGLASCVPAPAPAGSTTAEGTVVTGVAAPAPALALLVEALGCAAGGPEAAAVEGPLERVHAEEAANEDDEARVRGRGAGGGGGGGAGGKSADSRKTVSRQMGSRLLSAAFDSACVVTAKFTPFT